MFFAGSRYENSATYTITKADGASISAARLPLPSSKPLIGFHRRHEGQRLDLIASHYLADATAFWQLADANNSMAPDALAVHDLVGVPGKGR
jgi:hypothetical protein